MIQPRALQPFPELCCRPTPHRIFHYVAGMAFNFSKIEMSHFAPKQTQPAEAPKLPDAVAHKTL
jgi:hypothetical protein